MNSRKIIIGTELNYPPYSFLDEEGDPTGFNVDIAKAVAAAEELDIEVRIGLREALETKNVLLRELYHRTKNNMQVIASMIALRRFGVEDEEQRTLLLEIEGKIQSMALVHQRLYQTSDLSRLDLKSYIEELAGLIQSTFDERARNIRFEFDLEQVDGLIDTAIPLGLVLNELLVNSIKHAFPGNRNGTIRIRLQGLEGKRFILILEDDGVGLPPDFEPSGSSSLGLQTVYSIIEKQLNGSVELESADGTRWRLEVGEPEYQERV